MDFALNALGFALIITAFVLLRTWVRGRRRRAYQRFHQALNPPAAPAVCRQCGTPAAPGAAFCPRCGAALPPPLPTSAAVAPEYRRRKVIVYLVIAVLAVLGLAALKSARRPHPGNSPSRISPFDRHMR